MHQQGASESHGQAGHTCAGVMLAQMLVAAKTGDLGLCEVDWWHLNAAITEEELRRKQFQTTIYAADNKGNGEHTPNAYIMRCFTHPLVTTSN